jgi:hypothetical protein
MAGVYNITIKRNDTLSKQLTFVDDASAPVDLSGATLTMQVRKKADDTVLLSLTEADGIAVSGAGNNIVTLYKLVTIAAPGTYQYDLQAVFAGGMVRTYLEGSFTVEPDITL